jgi:TusA-related sulfurtransferase
MHKIDCFGDICPVPILKMQHEIELLKPGETFQMVVDHSCVIASVEQHLANSVLEYDIDEVMNGVWEITITRPETV